MQQTPSQRGIYARAALLSAIALPAFFAAQPQAHAWIGYDDAPRTHSGMTISDPRPTNTASYELVNPSMSAATIEGIINNANNASTVIFQGGTYRNVSNINVTRSDVTLRADKDARVWLDGSVPVTSWTRDGSTSSVWRTSSRPSGSNFEFPPLASPENTGGVDKYGTNPLADDGEMVFVNDVPQVQVASRAAVSQVGEFYIDRANDLIYVYSGSTAPQNVEISRHNKAFIIDALRVKLWGLNFQRYVGSARPRTGPTDNGGNPGLAVEFKLGGGHVDRCVFFWNGHGGLGLNANMIVERSQFVSNGWNGIGTTTKNSAIRGNYIAYNNVEGFNNAWSAAGMKLSSSAITENVDIYDNEIRANRGTGVWIDIFANDVRVFRNYIHDNRFSDGRANHGIFFEISKNCTAAFNIISGNRVGILAASPGTRVYNNTFYDNEENLTVKDETGRPDESVGGDDPNTVPVENELRVKAEVRNNIFMADANNAIDAFLGSVIGGRTADRQPSPLAASIKRFTALDYNVYPTGAGGFKWQLSDSYTPSPTFYNTLSAFRSAPDSATANFEAQGEERGSGVFLSASTRDFRIVGTDTEIARGGYGLPTAIRGLMRDQPAYPFVPDALTNARCNLADASIGSFGAAPTTGTYRGAFKPN